MRKLIMMIAVDSRYGHDSSVGNIKSNPDFYTEEGVYFDAIHTVSPLWHERTLLKWGHSVEQNTGHGKAQYFGHVIVNKPFEEVVKMLEAIDASDDIRHDWRDFTGARDLKLSKKTDFDVAAGKAASVTISKRASGANWTP